MHNKQPYSFEKTDVRGRFLLKFSCTNVKLETVSPIAANGSRLCEAVDVENQMFNLKQKIK